MSENRDGIRNDEDRNNDFLNEKEPIDSIEKTVEDLKKKIQELSEDHHEEDAPEASIPSFVTAEQKAKINEIKETTVNAVTDSINSIKEKAEEAKQNPDLAKTIEYIKANAMKAVDLAKVKIDDLKHDPRVWNAAGTAQDAVKKAGELASEKVQEAGKYIDEHLDEKTKENLQEAYENASKVITENTKKAVTAANDLYNKPEVQEKIEQVRKTASELVEQGSEKVRDLLNKTEKKDEEGN